MARRSLSVIRPIVSLTTIAIVGSLTISAQRGQPSAPRARRNIITFVADGLRHASVNETDAPTLTKLRAEGVNFENSYSLFPTLTMANASAIATGHQLGDTGIFANYVWIRRATFDTGNFGLASGTPTPYLENDQALGDIADRHPGALGSETLLATLRAAGYNTASIGKVGPAAIMDLAQTAPASKQFSSSPTGIVVDDATGTAGGVGLPASIVAGMRDVGLSLAAPTRSNGSEATSQSNNGYSGDHTHPGTLRPNAIQQQWFADVATRVVLPSFERDARKPFALMFWSRDPDGTQHNQGDSLGTLHPGINGTTSRQAVRNADTNLAQILGWLDAHPAIKANTDVIVTSDHGFATVSRREIDRTGRPTSSEPAKHEYVNANGQIDTDKGMLPTGFLAIDFAIALHQNLFDPDRRGDNADGSVFRKIRLESDRWEHPILGDGLIGDAVRKPDASDAKVVVTANGGSDLIYVPDGSGDTVRAVVDFLLGRDYVGGVFVGDQYGTIAGTLPIGSVALSGATSTPRPDIVVAFKVFYLNPDDLLSAVQIADTVLQEGQGYHGGLGRETTYNTMIAAGPDFKLGFVDRAPFSNADIVPTVLRILDVPAPSGGGSLVGRVAWEALADGPAAPRIEMKRAVSPPADGLQTILFFQELGGARYAYAACLIPDSQRSSNDPSVCRR